MAFEGQKRELKRMLKALREANPDKTVLLAKDGLSIGLFLKLGSYVIHVVTASGQIISTAPSREPSYIEADRSLYAE